jgi:hypothetical protein
MRRNRGSTGTGQGNAITLIGMAPVQLNSLLFYNKKWQNYDIHPPLVTVRCQVQQQPFVNPRRDMVNES